MKEKSKYFFSFFILVGLILLVVPFANAQDNWYVDVSEGAESPTNDNWYVDVEIPTTPINYSLVNVNNSDFWDGLDTPDNIVGSEFWYNQSLASLQEAFDLFVNITGDTMTGDLIIGSNNFSIDGNVGIGTSSPQETLHVYENISAQGTFVLFEHELDSQKTIHLKANKQTGVFLEATDSATDWSFYNNYGRFVLRDQTNGRNILTASLTGDLNLVTSSPSTSGVSIGYSSGDYSPTTRLDVNGSANITDDLIVGGNLTLADKITFALGEIIDNLVDGWLTITGNLNVTGNVTSENVFTPQYIFSHTNETIPVLAAGTWTNITFGQEDSDVKSGIEHTFNDNTNHTFTVMEDGIYNVDYDLDVEDTSVSASDIDVAGRLILSNGTEVKGSVFEIDITKQGAEAELSHNFLVSCRAGEVFVFQFTASDADVQISTHGTYGEYPESATVLMNKIANIP